MDHLAILLAKIESLRAEIADIQELNEQFRRDGSHGAVVQVSHPRRSERLQAIQHELGQLAHLGSRAIFERANEGTAPLTDTSREAEPAAQPFCVHAWPKEERILARDGAKINEEH
jgi:hypothetical protein